LQEEYPSLPVLDLDAVSKQQTATGTPTYYKIVAHFGKDILNADGSIDRKRLGGIVFNNDAQRKVLNGITHSAILRHTLWWLGGHFLRGTPAVVVDAPLLFEAKFHYVCGMTVVVAIDPELQLQRLMDRDKNGIEDAQARIKAQMPTEAKKKLATIVIDNSSTRENTRLAVRQLVGRIHSEERQWRLLSRTSLIAAVAAIGAATALYYHYNVN